MLPTYNQGETMIIEIQGNILQPIDRTDIIFKRSHVAIAVDYDIKKLNDKYYLYAQLPTTENNYTLFINDISTTVNGQNKVVDFNQSFVVSGNLTDYSVSPGFIITKNDFSLNIKSNLDQPTTINANFPSEQAITINPGNNVLAFNIAQTQPGLYLATIGKYAVPVQVLASSTNQSISNISLSVFPKVIREVLESNSPKNYTLTIKNNGELLENLYLSFNEAVFSVSPETISSINSNESVNISISLLNLTSRINEKIIIAKDSNALENVSFDLSFTTNPREVTNSSNAEYYCSELGGKFCTATEVCSGQLNQALDGSCCVGVCTLKEESSGSSWILYTFIGVAVLILIYIFFKYKKTSPAKSLNPPISSMIKK
jgi:6-pyruvoyl-tetrahydropterin synthase